MTAALAPALGDRAGSELSCRHCGLPAAGTFASDEDVFCCAGCRAAWSILHDAGLAGYYALDIRRTLAVAPSDQAFQEFDHPDFHAAHVRGVEGGLACADLRLDGVHCASCLWLVERLPRLVPGWIAADLEAPRSRVRLTWDPARVPLSAIARQLDRLGYRARPVRGARADAERRAEDRAALVEIGVAGALAMSVMMVAMALYGGWWSGMEPEFERYFRWVSLALTVPALAGPGRIFFRSAWTALRSRVAHMDLPIALALGAGFARGAYNVVAGTGPVYLDGLTMLVFLLRVGRFVQQRAQRAAADASELLAAMTPASGRVIENGTCREVPVSALLPGVEIEVRAGETLPADGVIVAGSAALDRSLLSGESRPIEASPGDEVFAGTLVHRATLRVRVTRAGESTRLAALARLVEEGTRRRAPVVRLADRWSAAFVVAVLALAVVTFAIWMPRDRSLALDHAIALLVVTCPCALALATPLAVASAIGRAARQGILVKGGDALETLASPGLLVLDKTGTLTEGRPRLVQWEGDEWVKPLVLALERESTHPLARAFEEAWPGTAAPPASGVRHTLGGGVEGVVLGRTVRVGAPAFTSGGTFAADAHDPTATPVHVAVDGEVVARATFGDPIRPEAAAALELWRAHGWEPCILSGDDPAVVRAIGARLGFSKDACRGGARPEDKLEFVGAAARRRTVVMVGDGVNDAAAIARATVGIAMRGGAEASLQAADVYFARGGLAPLTALFDGSRRTLHAIRLGIALSMAYNVLGAGLAIAGAIPPVVAAILMPASSITVVAAAWKANTFPEAKR